jgi:hypothetical protein
VKIRSLQSHATVSVRSIVQFDMIRVERPDKSAIKFANDDIRNNQEHGFDLRDRWDKTRILSIFPITPNTNKNIEK